MKKSRIATRSTSNAGNQLTANPVAAISGEESVASAGGPSSPVRRSKRLAIKRELASQDIPQQTSSNSTSTVVLRTENIVIPWTGAPEVQTVDEGVKQVGQCQHVITAAGQQQQSTAIRSGLLPNLSVENQLCIKGVAAQDGDSCGLWGLLPEELMEIILKQCTPAQLGMLESTSRFFRNNKLIERIAKHKLRSVPRARGLKPNKSQGETYAMLLQYVNCQSSAAAQATSIACGAYHTAALLIPDADQTTDKVPRHSLYTFGRGFHGQLGNNGFDSKKAPAHVSLGFKPCQDNCEYEEETMPAVVACGSHHSTAISRKGELFSWGLGCNGELGLGRWGPIELSLPRQCSSPSIRIVSVACGAHHTLAIAENGTLWSCGKNRHGQLGNNTMVDGSRLQMVMNLGSFRVVSSAAGAAHSMALASDGSLFTWGDGSRGQLGHNQLQNLAALMPAGQPITMASAQKIARLDPLSLSAENRVTAIAAGAHHSMALTVGGAILAFGSNDKGQLGTGDRLDRWKPTRVPLALSGEENTCLRVVQLACGSTHSLALFSRQGSLQVRTTGSNNHGQLGHGDRQDRDVFTPVPRLANVVAVQAGDEHSAAVTASGQLFMWGRGDCGQLGTNDARAKWKPTLLKGYQVVHPDKTLRRNKRSSPLVRKIPMDASQACTPVM